MKRSLLTLAATALLTIGPPGLEAETARERSDGDCRDYCAEKAAEKCDDVSSTWCNVYIVGCLAGCGVSHL